MKWLKILFRNYRFRSIVISNFFILISLSLLSAGMFYYFTQNLFHEQYRKDTRQSYLYTLGSLSASLDAQLNGVAQSMEMAMRYEDIIRASLNPDPQDYTRRRNITTFLSNVLVENAPLVRQAYYYVWNTDEVYTSTDAVLTKEEFDKGYLLDLLDTAPQYFTTLSLGEQPAKLYLTGSMACLIQDFPLEKRLGTLVCVLDLRQLHDALLRGGTASGSELFVYTQDGQPVFSLYQDYPQGQPAPDALGVELVRLGDQEFYAHTGTLLPWVYLYRIGPGKLAVDQTLVFQSFLPFLVLFLLISLVVAVYATLHIYHPVNQLIESVRPTGGTLKSHRNEFEFLQRSYESIVSRMGQYSQTLQQVTPAVLRNLFNNLIMGRESDRAAIQQTLDSLDGPFQLGDRYVVVLARVLQLSTAHLPETESNVCQLRLTQLLQEILPSGHDTCAYLFSDYRGDLVTVLSFPPTTLEGEIQGTVSVLRAAFLEQGGQWPYRMLLAAGSACLGITTLSESYGEALQAVRTEQYRITDASAAEELEIGQSSFGLGDVEYDGLRRGLRQVQTRLQEGALETAQGELDTLVDEVAATVAVADVRHYYQHLIDSVLDWTIPLATSEDGPTMLGQVAIREELERGSLEETVSFVKGYCRKLMTMIQTGAKKKQNRYITTAKDHIAQNYADSSLSLNAISDHIGIHASYLGRLFRDYLGQHFTSYLNEYRVEIARQLLTATNWSVTEIGFKTGFSSAQSFIRVFKKHTGTTPGQYREERA